LETETLLHRGCGEPFCQYFSGIAFNSNLEIVSLELETDGIVEQDQAGSSGSLTAANEAPPSRLPET
jgi:hypothetical protein